MFIKKIFLDGKFLKIKTQYYYYYVQTYTVNCKIL